MTREILYKMFEDSPGDLAAYGAIADDLDADGWSKLAHAFRWMWKRGVYPHKRTEYGNARGKLRVVPKSFRWAWYTAVRSERNLDQPHDKVYPKTPVRLHALPWLLLPAEQKVFATHQAAVMFLAEQLAKVGEVYCADPPGPRGLPLYDVIDTGGIRVPPPTPADVIDIPGVGTCAVIVEREAEQ